MAVVEITIVPIGVQSTSLSSYVAGAEMVLEQSSLQHELTGMGTIVWGDLDEILKTVRLMHESVFSSGAMRVLTQIRIDDRRDKKASPEQKIKSVRSKMK